MALKIDVLHSIINIETDEDVYCVCQIV